MMDTHEHKDPDMSVHVVVVASIFIFLTLVVTSLRVYCRLTSGTFRLGCDDVLICVAAVFGVGFLVTSLLAAQLGGYGRREKTRDEEALRGQTMYYSTAMYMLTMGLVKLSIVALYIRLSVSPVFRFVAYSLITFITVNTIINVLVILFPCNPVQKAWDRDIPGKCLPLLTFIIASAAINIATDIAVVVLPIQMLWTIRIPLRQKISLYILFGLGGGACIAGAVRLFSFLHLKMHHKGDAWFVVSPMISSLVEVGVAIIIASGPALKCILRRRHTDALESQGSGDDQSFHSQLYKTPSERFRGLSESHDLECVYPPAPPPSPGESPLKKAAEEQELSFMEMMVVVDRNGRVQRC